VTEVVVADNITCMAGGRAVVSDVSLRLLAGESLALLGPSGSGKTVLLTTLGGLIPPDSGMIWVMGEPLEVTPERWRQIALVFQTYGLFPLLTAVENVEIALRAVGWQPDAARTAADEALDRLGLASFAHHLVVELSGGQEQRVAVARALALRPRVILADEPTTEQDHDFRDLVLDRLLEPTATGSTVLIATHDDEVAGRCDRILELQHGQLVTPAAGDH